MRKIALSFAMLLLLSGSHAFASENKNSSRGERSGMSAHHGRGHHKRHHKGYRRERRERARSHHNKNM